MPRCARCNKTTFDGTQWKSTAICREFNGKYLCKACYQATETEKLRIETNQNQNGQYPLRFIAKYLGGHAAYANKAEGNLWLYPDQVTFTAPSCNIKIPFPKIKDAKIITQKEFDALRLFVLGLIALAWQREDQYFSIAFQDELGDVQNPVFIVPALGEFSSKLYQLRLQKESGQ
jgi:hypothetical protein